MLVCHCNGVTDRAIRSAVRDGAFSAEEVGQACGAGTCCGGCSDAVAELIHVEGAHRSGAESGQPAPSNKPT
jgi:bacterioferritin-associated ferredoxin